MEVHFDVFPAPGEVETGRSVVIEFEVRHTVGEASGFFGVFFDFVEGSVVFDAVIEALAEADLMADVGPICRAKAV